MAANAIHPNTALIQPLPVLNMNNGRRAPIFDLGPGAKRLLIVLSTLLAIELLFTGGLLTYYLLIWFAISLIMGMLLLYTGATASWHCSIAPQLRPVISS